MPRARGYGGAEDRTSCGESILLRRRLRRPTPPLRSIPSSPSSVFPCISHDAAEMLNRVDYISAAPAISYRRLDLRLDAAATQLSLVGSVHGQIGVRSNPAISESRRPALTLGRRRLIGLEKRTGAYSTFDLILESICLRVNLHAGVIARRGVLRKTRSRGSCFPGKEDVSRLAGRTVSVRRRRSARERRELPFKAARIGCGRDRRSLSRERSKRERLARLSASRCRGN